MKKLLIIVIALFGFGLVAGPATATDLGIHGAYWNTDQADRTFGFGAKLRFSFVELRGTYFDDVTADVEPESADFEIKAYPLEAGIVIQFLKNSMIRPYIGGGAGYYVLDTTVGDIDDEIGYYLVGGADIGSPGSRVAFSIEAIYRNIEGTVRGDFFQDLDLDEDVPLDLSGIGANAGVVFRF
ncbi:MAG: porin family protein [Acidobacteriota bacterium]|nr:porin family protein [Acidobacteriota bacterium]MDQ5872240.1 porin family protein [Acidobacteriota bacterium]